MVQTHSDKSITRFSMQSFSNRLVPAVSPGSARATEAMAPFALQPQTKTPEYGAATAPSCAHREGQIALLRHMGNCKAAEWCA